MTDVFDGKYVSITTFTKDGRRKPTPVWIARLGEGAGFTTDVDSWKAKRIRNTPAVELSPSDAKGNVAPGAEVVAGSASIVLPGSAEYTALDGELRAKYGLWFWFFQTIGGFRRRFGKTAGDCGVLIQLAQAEN